MTNVQLAMNSLTLAEPDTNKFKHMAPQLQDFPDELLVEVLGYLPKSDLKSARLTCTRYASIGAQWLFQRVYFAPRKAAMDTFLKISANPTFARTVTELVYDARLFLPELAAYKPFKEAFDAHIEDEFGEDDENIAGVDQAGDSTGPINNVDDDNRALSRSTVSRRKNLGDERYHEFLANNLVRYARLVDQQQSILKDRKDYEALSAGLRKFPSISKTTILDHFSGMLRYPGYLSQYYQRCSREIAVPLQPSEWLSSNTLGEGDMKKWDVRGIYNLIRALSEHCQILEQLHIGPYSSHAPMTIFGMDKDLVNDACTVAKRLTYLEVNVKKSTSDSIDDVQEFYDCFNKSLTAAKEIRCLAINGRIDSKLFKKRVWPYLEKLNLGELAMDATEIKAITQTHKCTLRELKLRNVYMFGEEGWADAAKEMGKYLRLRRVSVLGVCDEVTYERTRVPYLEPEANLAVARSFMQSIPRTILLAEDEDTIIACPEEDSSLVEIGDSHKS